MVLLLPLLLPGAERWIEIHSGPLQVLGNAGDQPAREVTNELEQVRWALGSALGNQDLKTVWPVRVLVLRNGSATPVSLARNTYIASEGANAPISPEWLRAYVKLLIESNSGRMPADIESGLESFYSLAQIAGTRITLGQPPPLAERTLDWARVALLQTDADYSGRMRVLLYNLQRGADAAPAFRNAFGKTEQQIDESARANMAANRFSTTIIGGRPLDPRRDLFVREAAAPVRDIALADLKFVQGNGHSAYDGLAATLPAESHEGLALVLLGEGKTAEAQHELNAAIDAGTQSARVYYELARIEPDKTKAVPLLEKAIALNPSWAEPHALFASRIVNPDKKLQELNAAAKLDPRNAANWRALAAEDVKQNKFADAAKAYDAADHAANSADERAAIREESRDIQGRRLEFEQAERERTEQEKQRALQQVKDAAMAQIRAAEQRANQGQAPPPPDRKVVQWEDLPVASGRVHGRIVRVDCLRAATRIAVESEDKKLTFLSIRDASRVAVSGASELGFCKAPVAPREVVIEYFPKSDAKLGTAGEVASIEFAPAARGEQPPTTPKPSAAPATK